MDVRLLETSQVLWCFFHINLSLEIHNSLLSMMGASQALAVWEGELGSQLHKRLHVIRALRRGNVPCERMPQPRGSLIIVKRDYSFLSSSCHCPRVHTRVHTRKHMHHPYVNSPWKLISPSASLPLKDPNNGICKPYPFHLQLPKQAYPYLALIFFQPLVEKALNIIKTKYNKVIQIKMRAC